MRYFSLVLLLFSASICAQTARIHPNYKGVTIPEDFSTPAKVSVDAIIGDVVVLSPFINIKINGKGPYHFIFDTGWSQSVISHRVAKALDLPIVDSFKRRAVTPNQVVEMFHDRHLIKELQIGQLTLKNYGIDASSAFEDEAEMFQDMDRRVDGILGPNAFYGLLFQIDYKNEKVHFFKGDLDPNDPQVIPYDQNDSVPNIKVTLEFEKLKKNVAQQFIIDTGNAFYINVNSCDIPAMQEFTGKEPLGSSDFAGNSQTSHFAKLYGNVRFSSHYEIKNPYITFSQRNCDVHPVGLLGRKFFEKHLVTVDHDSRLVKIEPY